MGNGKGDGKKEGRAGEMEEGKESVCLCDPIVVLPSVLSPSVSC